jgi:CHAT domain-containing protein
VAATEAQVRKKLPTARFVHLATHGFFADPNVGSDLDRRSSRGKPSRNPLSLTGVVLAGANDAGSAQQTLGADGIMSAEEVVDLSMSRTELVVLSACETGLGEVAAGEGAFGLQRAFALAGADSVIASLWKVDDAATRTLMSEFYRNLLYRKMGKLAALRAAQLTMIRSYDPKKQSLSGNRGLKITKKKTSPDKKDGTGTSEHLPPFFWAAFVLSGEWR